ncbi:MAG: hypothetical protein RLZZ511_3548 [Cyanobacteriota bacterium]|jgi:hypothetical protein
MLSVVDFCVLNVRTDPRRKESDQEILAVLVLEN